MARSKMKIRLDQTWNKVLKYVQQSSRFDVVTDLRVCENGSEDEEGKKREKSSIKYGNLIRPFLISVQ